jgi:hypothetical protein
MIDEGSRLPTITQILDRAENNRHVSRHLLSEWFSLFQEVIVSHDGIMTPGFVQGNLENLTIPMLLVNYAFSYFIAAVDTCLSGQVSPCFALLRLCIESSVYAHEIVRKPELGPIWTMRGNLDADLRACKARFNITHFLNELPETSPAPRAMVRSLYDRTISYGGHPNSGGALSVGGVDETDEYVSVGIEVFSEGCPLLHALKATADVGYAMVCLEDLMFNVQLAPAGLPERIVALSAAGLHNTTAAGNKPAE